jgi:2Fe-2S type ferredoxin
MPFRRVRLEPGGKVIEVGEGEDIWTAAGRQGVALPSSCLEGSCTTCTGRLLEGEVEQDRALALREQDKARGFVLLCVARPRSDCVVRTHCADEL